MTGFESIVRGLLLSIAQQGGNTQVSDEDNDSTKLSPKTLTQPLVATCGSLAEPDPSTSLLEAAQSARVQPKFADVTKLVFTIFNVDITAVTLVDKDSCWFKSVQGQQGADFEMDSLEACFCSYSIAQDSNEVLVVEDARQDAR